MRRRRPPVPGVCLICRCTDEYGCAEGCAWANTTHTICTACVDGLAGVVTAYLAARRRGEPLEAFAT